MNWRQAHTVFEGGTDAVHSLFGRRVRVLHQMTLNQYVPQGLSDRPAFEVAIGQQGFVGRPVNLDIVVVFPIVQTPFPAGIKALMSKDFASVLVNWPTFRAQFEVLMPD